MDLKLVSRFFEFKDSAGLNQSHAKQILKLTDLEKVWLFLASIISCGSKKNQRLRALRLGQDRLETVMSIICIVDKLREIKSEGIDFSKVIDLLEPEAEEANEEVQLVSITRSQDSDDDYKTFNEATINGPNTKVEHDG